LINEALIALGFSIRISKTFAACALLGCPSDDGSDLDQSSVLPQSVLSSGVLD